MRNFYDAIADAYFAPDDDGTVRFTLFVLVGGYLTLDLEKAEAEGMKILWRPLVRYYIHACHASVLVSFINSIVGLLLLLTLCLARLVLINAIKRRYKRQVVWQNGPADWAYGQLSHAMSRPVAVSLHVFATVVVISSGAISWLEPAVITSVVDPDGFLCLLLVAVRWSFLFASMWRSPRAKEAWAQAAKS